MIGSLAAFSIAGTYAFKMMFEWKENETLCEHFITHILLYVADASHELSVEEIDVSAPIETCANMSEHFEFEKPSV